MAAPLFVLEVPVEELPVPPLDPPPASPDPLEPTGLVGGTPSVPVAAEPERVLEEAEDLVEVLIVLMVLEFDIIEDCAYESRSIHPAVEMLKADIGALEVRSNIGFSSLPRSYSNTWLSDQLAFRPSSVPTNDILVVHLRTIQGHRVLADPSDPARGTEYLNPRLQGLALDLIGLTTALLLVVGLVFSVLLGDLWSTVLFVTYFFHALASLAVSVTSMMSTTDVYGGRVREDATLRYAIHQRVAGGKVVFKGRQDTLETWARMSWAFRRSPVRDTLHWSWTLTGTLSAAASVVCMVNMAGYLQLAYLGTLLLSSLGEIFATQLVRSVQRTSVHYGEVCLQGDNQYWSRAVIRSALDTDDRFSLADLPWMEFGMFPEQRLWRNLCDVLQVSKTDLNALTHEAIVARLSDGVANEKVYLSQRLASEIAEARTVAMKS
ncbi:hypothetical protein B0A55_02673 [Friedmanniomyces simplex]|uniref:Uncharacterized protein n=1 Tax=Friedmanniomyces simplex TaxID=329884 RepID=A0A4U0XQ75_9PEZI|nr:hypothetical protein B0A55_02673 [Friedmanniomyces simplex]